MNLNLTGPPGGSGLWEAVKIAIQGGWQMTIRFAVLLILIYLLGSGAVHAVLATVVTMLHRP
jgi:hypothetical protein